MNHVMLDIESMSTNPGNALVLSIGAVRFNFGDTTPLIGNAFSVVLDPREQLAMCRDVSKSTQQFWRGESKEARGAWMHPTPTKLPEAMQALALFIAEPDPKTVWANGITFDLANIESLFASVGMSTPWAYNAARDARTVYRTCPLIPERQSNEVFDGVAHDPVDDCVRQIHGLWAHLRELS